MDKIFEQTFNYASILPLRNYSRLSDKPEFVNISSFDDDYGYNLDSDSCVNAKFFRNNKKFNLDFISHERHLSEMKKKGRLKFFYNEKDIEHEKVFLYPLNKNKTYFYTTRNKHIRRYFSDPFTAIETNTYKRVIYKDNDKLIIKILHKAKYRNVNWRYFKEKNSFNAVSFNLKTGNFKVINQNGNISKQDKLSTRFRTNSFDQLKCFVESNYSFYIKDKSKAIFDKNMANDFIKTFDNNEFLDAINKSLFNNPVNNLTKDNIFDTIVNDFIIKRKIKVPNNYKKLLINYYPKVRVLKKNDNKLIQSILDMFKIKTKHNIKLLHENPKINIVKLVHTCYLFGEDFYHYVNKIPPDYFIKNDIGNKYEVNENFTNKNLLSKDEKDNMLNVFIDYYKNDKKTSDIEILIFDHLDMLKKIKEYYPEARFSPRTKIDFTQQHEEFSRILVKIIKGWTTEFKFPEQMLDDVEKEFVALKDNNNLINLKPFVLKRDDDYIEEGSFMHHCVASYINSDKSIVISLRTLDDEDRVTCEFNMQTGKVLQKRHFCNRNPPEHFIDGIDQLEEKVLKYARWGLLNWKEKSIVPIKINGIEVKIENPKPKTFHDVLMEDPFI